MAFKGLIGSTSGDLNNAEDSYGYFDDTVYVVNQATFQNYSILTYRGDDLVDLRDAYVFTALFVYAGSGNDTVLGGTAKEQVFDQSGNDKIALGDNSDTVYAGVGNDIVDGGNGVDEYSFAVIYDDFGLPELQMNGIICDLQITIAQDFGTFGKDRLKSIENLNGSFGNDQFFGTSGENNFVGSDGKDFLQGRGGDDLLAGDNGADTLIGDGGGDDLFCGLTDGARDTLRYSRISDSGLGTVSGVVDVISQFDAGGGATDDRIDLSRIDARPSTAANDAFIFRGTGIFSSAKGEVRLEVIGSDTLIHVDIDGDGQTEMNIFVLGVTGLTASDFIL
jgi:Ca2+-binding RTX toxin-like protein